MRGQTLIEVLVALGIIAVVATAIGGVVITSQGNASFGKNNNLASQYANEGLEIIRSMRDSDYSYFRSIASGSYCLDKGKNDLGANCFSANVDGFLRKINITQNGCSTNVAKVEAVVSWQDSKCSSTTTFCHSSVLSTCLSSVNPVPTF